MKITFIPDTPIVEQIFGIPEQAKKSLPEWYIETDRIYQKSDKINGLNLLNANATNTTIKSCMPFFDALSAGYIWKLPVDLELRKFENEISVKWRYGSDGFIETHHRAQFEKMPLPFPSKDSAVFKFKFEYKIKTPKGYSTLFTHPLNSHDLPFRTFSGIVDTDTYPMSVQFPFQIHSDFGNHAIIRKGTPIIQFIPFKRDVWESEVEKYDEIKNEKAKYTLFSKIQNSYKSQFWQRKTFN
jgi:hypothetical protein